MSVKNILLDLPVDAQALENLQARLPVRVEMVGQGADVSGLSEFLGRTQILFCSFPGDYFGELASLELIQIAAVGFERLYNLDLGAKGIRVCNSRGVFDTAIAEWNLAMMVNLARDLRGMIRNQEAGIWDRAAAFQREIRGSTVGIFGYGGIGRETARLAKTLGLRVHALSRHGVQPRRNTYCVPDTGDPAGVLPDRVFRAGEELEFLSGLDFLVVAMPKTRSTTGIVGERELEALPRSAFVLNPARATLIQESALLRALQEGWIAGAALDAHYAYPMPKDHPLWRFPNVIMTPHISGSTLSPYYTRRIWDIFLQNVGRFLAGQPLLNELTPAELRGE